MSSKIKSQQQFVEKAAPEYWYSYAHELADTADFVYQKQKASWIAYEETDVEGVTSCRGRPAISRPVLLMYGLSLENLIKGILVSEKPDLLNGGQLHKSLLSHDLRKLIGNVSAIKVSDADMKLLSLLSDVVPYYGRYPVPRRWQEVEEEQFVTEDIYERCRALFKTLEMELYRLNIRGIDAPEGVRFANLRLTHLDETADFVTDKDREKASEILESGVFSSKKGT